MHHMTTKIAAQIDVWTNIHRTRTPHFTNYTPLTNTFAVFSTLTDLSYYYSYSLSC